MVTFNTIILIFCIYLGIGYLLVWLDDRSIQRLIEHFKKNPSVDMMPGTPEFWIKFLNAITWPMMLWDFIHAFWVVFKRKNNLR